MKKQKEQNFTEAEIGYDKLFKIIISGCKFKYLSYDHKKAIEEYNASDKYHDRRIFVKNPDSYSMPEELKEKHKVYRIGKLREVHFSTHGKAWRFIIGNKYNKSFRLDDFGVNVFPII